MERKSFTEVKQGDSCQFEAVIATLGVIDSDGDVIEPGAFGNRDGVPVIWAHDSSKIPLGSVSIREVGDEVVATGELIDGRACGWLRHAQANGVRQEWSWGFIPMSSRPGKLDGQNVRFIEDLDLLEVSGVLRGASVGTGLLDVKEEKSCSCGCAGTCETSRPRSLTKNEAIIEELDLRKRGKFRAKFDPPPAWLQRITVQVAREFDCEGRPSVTMFRRAKLTEGRAAPFDLDCIGLTNPSDQPFPAVYVKAGMSDFDTLTTALHEVCHLLGQKDERTCDAWAVEQAARFIDPEVGDLSKVKGIRLADGTFTPMVFPS